MESKKNLFELGEKVTVQFPDNGNKVFRVEGFTEDEFALSGYSTLDHFSAKEFVIAQSTYFDGKRLTIGDKVKVVTKKGEITEAYVAYILNKDNLVVSLKNNSSLSSLKWLIKMMSELYGS